MEFRIQDAQEIIAFRRNSLRKMRNKSRRSGIKNCVAFHIRMRNKIAIGNPLVAREK